MVSYDYPTYPGTAQQEQADVGKPQVFIQNKFK